MDSLPSPHIFQTEYQAEERAELARTLHDEFGAALTVLTLGLGWIQRHTRGEEGAVAERAGMLLAVTQDLTATVRRLSLCLRAPLPDELDLQTAVQQRAAEFQAHTGIACHTRVELGETPVPPRLALILYRAVQELLTNVARHALARQVSIRLRAEETALCLEVQDDGRGFPEDPEARPEALGLRGLRERVEGAGGRLVFRRSPSGGAEVAVRLPCPAENSTK